jgi:hypothetical protein
MTMKQAEWVTLVEEWRGSRQSARQFAMAHGVTDTALRYWAGRLAALEDAAAAKPSRRGPAPRSSPAIARIVRPGEAPAAQTGGITIVVGKAAIVVEPGFEDAHLRNVVRALSEVG